MSENTTSAAAPGWYPDGSGGHRWWDGRAWTEHVSLPTGAAPAAEPVPLPEGTRIDTVAIWVVSLAMLVATTPAFFLFDVQGYMAGFFPDPVTGYPTGIGNSMSIFVTYMIVAYALQAVGYVATVLSARADYRHLISVGVVRPFHWAFAFIPWVLVYLIGRHVVLRRVSRTSGAPLWVNVGLTILQFIGSMIWASTAMVGVFAELPFS
ncbi:DUF2510 domain-containing protein [Homoserinibacter sp. GY 40078]|uniref:DUF2510 domain-containing protein n=1 Tax=Homoserinibacter sp. GY 40078 TaxID=2603275 RepID=UPI001650B139|nr:DUF2510 domain-containing protein [Homoserinibacter sp. GY 40078]